MPKSPNVAERWAFGRSFVFGVPLSGMVAAKMPAKTVAPELRKMAEAEVESRRKTARAELLRRETEILTEITAQGLSSEAAQELFKTLPTAEQLMPQTFAGRLREKNATASHAPGVLI